MEIREIRNALKRIYKERKSWNGAKGPFTESAIRQRELILIKQKILYRIEDAKLLKDKGEEYFYLALYKIMNNYINANKLEGEIFEKIRKVSHNPKFIEKYISDFSKKQLQEKSKLQRLADKLRKEIIEIKKKKKEIVEWLAKTLPDRTTTQNINIELENIDKKTRKFEEDLLIVEARIQNLKKGNFATEIICGYLKKFDYLYESFNSARRKLLIESLVKKVTVDSKKKIDLKLSLPLYPLSSLPNRACPERSRRVQGGISCLG